jgi:putative nucleotidyltransferase-like protein
MLNTPEFQLLLEVIRQLSRAPAAELNLSADGLDPGPLTQLAVRHGLAGLLALGLPNGHPAQVAVAQVASLARLRSMEGAAALAGVSEALDVAGIRHIAFKGPSTAIRFYGDLGLRPFLDVDVLVEEEDLEEAFFVAAGMGYELDPRLDTQYLDFTSSKHLSQVRGSVRLELHHRLFNDKGIGHQFKEYWHRRDHLGIGSTVVPCLGREDAIFHAAIHGTSHAFLSLKWLADLACLQRSGEGWPQALKQAEDCGMKNSFLCGPTLLKEMGAAASAARGLGDPPRQLRRLVAASRRSWEMDYDALLFLTHQRFRMLPPGPRLAEVIRVAFKPTASDWRAVPWLSPRVPLVFSLLRPVRVALKYGRLAIRTMIKKDRPRKHD